MVAFLYMMIWVCQETAEFPDRPFFWYHRTQKAIYPSGSIFKVRILLKSSVERATDTISARGMDHHTMDRPYSTAKRYAAGRITRSWRAADTIRLYIPFPRAWKTEPTMMQYPAKMKLRLMILKAGTPISSICSEASKNPRSCAGKI